MSSISDKVHFIRTKRELMELVYSQEELSSIDGAVPIDTWKDHDPFYHVMNYNDASVFGKLENLEEIAKKRNIKFKFV